MDQQCAGLGVLFVAGFGPITRESDESKAFYVEALGLPLKPMPGNETYLLSEQGALDGVKHFALWPLAQAAQSCFGDDRWPADLALPQAWIEFDVADMAAATQGLVDRGYRLLVANREEPWGRCWCFAMRCSCAISSKKWRVNARDNGECGETPQAVAGQ
ncbi:MAG: glyoxalase [Serratia marcescens]|nr:glyoxalase [Serratia marcescens]